MTADTVTCCQLGEGRAVDAQCQLNDTFGFLAAYCCVPVIEACSKVSSTVLRNLFWRHTGCCPKRRGREKESLTKQTCLPQGRATMRFESTAKVLAKCKLEYYRISECARARSMTHQEFVKLVIEGEEGKDAS